MTDADEWIDGDWGCDCNRSDLFHGDGEHVDAPCIDYGSTNRYVILSITLDSGAVVYTEAP